MAELVLVTGGSGYIAGWCIAELLSSFMTCNEWPELSA